MGSLAFWRAVEGAGKGITLGTQLRHDEQIRKMEADREARLAEMKIKADRDMASQRMAMDVYNTDRQIEQREMQHEEVMGARAQQHEESMAAQKSSQDLAQQRLGIEKQRAEQDRYDVFQVQEKIPVGEQERPEGVDEGTYQLQMMLSGGPGIYETKTKVMRFDKQTGELQEQRNGKWAPAALEGPDKMLYENPDKWREYESVFGRLPEWYNKMFGGSPSGSQP